MRKNKKIQVSTDSWVAQVTVGVFMVTSIWWHLVLAENGVIQSQPSQGAAVLNKSSVTPKFRERIRMDSLFSSFYTVRVAFSPDSRYLAVGEGSASTVIVWDMKFRREQSRIDLAENRNSADYKKFGGTYELIWSPDGRYITTGLANFSGPNGELRPMTLWDPMTGKSVHQIHKVAQYAYFNHDGSKLATVAWRDGIVTIYDTQTWESKEFDTGLIVLENFSWTVDDKFVAIGGWTKKFVNGQINSKQLPTKLRNGELPPDFSMLAIKLDPSEKEKAQLSILGGPEPDKTGIGGPLSYPFMCYSHTVTNFASHKAMLNCGPGITRMLDLNELKIAFTFDVNATSGAGTNGRAFDSSGKYAYLLAYNRYDKTVDSSIIDTTTGEVVGHFPSAESHGLAISPDGKTMAVGHKNHIEIFDLQ